MHSCRFPVESKHRHPTLACMRRVCGFETSMQSIGRNHHSDPMEANTFSLLHTTHTNLHTHTHTHTHTCTQTHTCTHTHQLMLNAGIIRQLASGLYHFLPLGLRALEKLVAVIDSEMQAIGGIKISMPILTPSTLWKASG